MSTLNYLKSFITDKNVASVTPSSRFLTRKVCSYINFSKDRNIVEFGPGNGVVTQPILDNLTSGSCLIAIETNENFVEQLNAIDDQRLIVVHDSVENLESVVNKYEVESLDYIVSGIPFSFLDDEVKQKILEVSRKMLANDGKFIAYQTSRHLEGDLRNKFDHVTTEMEWRNIPPMCVYSAWMHRQDGV